VPLLILFLAILPATAQLVVDTYAGGAIQTGVPANTAFFGDPSGIAFQGSNVVFSDPANNVIRSVGTNGVLVTIAGTGVAGFGGDGGAATSSLLNSPTVLRTDSSGRSRYFPLRRCCR
jgi:hypothetical protein